MQARRVDMQGVVTMDGDGQHGGADIPRLIDAANRNPRCVIVGARLRKRAAQPVYRRIGNDFGDWGIGWGCGFRVVDSQRSEEHTSELQSLMRITYAVFCMKKQKLERTTPRRPLPTTRQYTYRSK